MVIGGKDCDNDHNEGCDVPDKHPSGNFVEKLRTENVHSCRNNGYQISDQNTMPALNRVAGMVEVCSTSVSEHIRQQPGEAARLARLVLSLHKRARCNSASGLRISQGPPPPELK